MKYKALVLLVVASLLFSAVPAVAQGTEPPPFPTANPVRGPRPLAPTGPDGVPTLGNPVSAPAEAAMSLQSVVPGASGTSFRYAGRFGVTAEGYVADNQHMDSPNGLFIDGNNQLYVAEEVGSRVLKFDLTNPTPTDPPTASLTLGEAGMHLADWGLLNFPREAVTDGAGNIWVVAQSFVKEFDATGTLLKTIPATNPWEAGSDDYHFQNPFGIAFGAGNYLYVSDKDNQRIQIYDVSGTPKYVATIGETGVSHSDNNGFNQPFQIAFDGNDLYVMDAGNFRVQHCTSSSPWDSWSCTTFFGETGVQGSDDFHLSWAIGIGIHSTDIFLADGLNNRVMKCNMSATCGVFAGVTGVWGSDDQHFGFPDDVAVDSDGNVYVSDSTNDRVQEFDSLGIYQDTFGVTGVPYVTDTTRLFMPWGVAVAADGSIYATEQLGNRLIKRNSSGAQLWAKGQAGVDGNDNNHFGNLEGNPAVDAAGRVYVSDTGNNRVQIYNSNGTYFATLGTGWGQGNYQFACPTGIAISPVNGDIYVTDQCNQRIQVFSSARIYKATLGQTGHFGPDNWSFNIPRGVAVDRSGNIYVADADNDRVQKCTLTGGCTTFVGVQGSGYWGVPGSNVSDFSHLHPMSVAVDSAGRVYVADDWSVRVQVFDASGAYLASIGGRFGQGNSDLILPAGVAVDSSGNVYVTDKENQRIEKFAPGFPNWTQVSVNGFGNVANIGVWSMAVFNGRLYAGTINGYNGAEVWRSSNGQSWTPFSPPSTGADTVMDMEVFGGKLYIGLSRAGGGEVWRTDGASWEQVVWNGFDDGNNYGINALAVFSNQLYAATSTNDGVMKVYRSPNGTSWNPFVTNGLGAGFVAQDLTMTVNGIYLYLGLGRDSGSGSVAELWRTNGTTWQPVFTDGLGSPNNTSVSAMAAFSGAFYIGLRNLTTGGEVWKWDGVKFTKVINAGNGNPNNQRPYGLNVLNSNLYVTFSNQANGAQVWRSSNGTSWTQISYQGWGDELNIGGSYFNKGATVFNGSLYSGVFSNAFKGAQIWRYNNPAVTVVLTSRGPEDGSILEKSKGNGIGGSMNFTAVTFPLGDSALNQQYKAVLSFQTSSLPAGALVKSAVLKIKPSGSPTGVNPFTILGSLYADVRKPFFGLSLNLELGDFNALPSAAKVATFGKTPVSGWYTATLNATGLANINRTTASGGLTQFRLYFSVPTNSNLKADLMPFYSGNATTTVRPQLVITYTP